jgi:hypothetical protein
MPPARARMPGSPATIFFSASTPPAEAPTTMVPRPRMQGM